MDQFDSSYLLAVVSTEPSYLSTLVHYSCCSFSEYARHEFDKFRGSNRLE